MASYYTDTRGMDVRAYAPVMAVDTVIDASDSPIYGCAPDRTRSG